MHKLIMESSFTVSIFFSDQARQYLKRASGPPKQHPGDQDQLRLQHVQAGDFVRIEGIPGLYEVSHRVWHLMADQSELKIVLDGPIQEDG